MSKGEVKNPAQDGRMKNNQSSSRNKRGGHTTPENQHDKRSS